MLNRSLIFSQGTIREPPSSTKDKPWVPNMEEIGKAQQRAIARLIRQWISSDASRRQLRQLLDLPTDADMPREHRSLLDELDRRVDE
ncbi:hypothetical protein FJ960_23080 [Mesorhizobium sp. B2-3-11]|nr:hypothetical protein [Mesorhizobium sp. B2-3-11]TPL98060.1 hypothetical protein FJ960_23080 [Mesorhizobium sp. B2-3-11]